VLRLAAAAPRQQQHSQAHPRRHLLARGGATTADFRTSAAQFCCPWSLEAHAIGAGHSSAPLTRPLYCSYY
jgi:hypothetical protein